MGHCGNKPWKITPAIIDKMRHLASTGLTKTQCAIALGIARKTLYNKFEEVPEFEDAFYEGKDMADSKVQNALYEKACSGDVGAMIHWTTNRDPENWKNSRSINLGGGDKPIESKITIELVKPDAKHKAQ